MTTETAITTEAEVERTRKLALYRAIGLDKLPAEQRELVLNIAKRYELDLLLKHLVLIDGRPYITRDGLLHVAHRSGKLDGIGTTEPTIIDDYWRATATVYRKDMSHPFVYSGRYPTKGGNQRFAPEMAVKVAEVMALRRAFDVALPATEERWDREDVDATPVVREDARSRIQARLASRLGVAATPEAETESAAESGNGAPSPSSEPTGDPGPTAPVQPLAKDGEVAQGKAARCGALSDPTLGEIEECAELTGHRGPHKGPESIWPNK